MQRVVPELEQGKLFQLTRLGIVMTPEKDDPREIEGVLNPGAARGPDGQLYLFPRLVAHGNFSRIGIARVQFNGEGDPIGVQRLGIALEMRRPAHFVCRTPATLCDDVYRLWAQGPANRTCELKGSVSLGPTWSRDISGLRRP